MIVENRVDDLLCYLAWQNCIAGITRSAVQLQDDRRILILVELPGVSDHELVISTIRETGLLEFVNAGLEPIPEGTVSDSDQVMDQGCLVEQGHRTGTQSAHEVLLARGGLYTQLYQTQFRHTPDLI